MLLKQQKEEEAKKKNTFCDASVESKEISALVVAQSKESEILPFN